VLLNDFVLRFTTRFLRFFIIFSASLSINIASITANGVDLSPIPYVGQSVGWSVCLYVRKVYCGKTADWIQMPFGMMSGVGKGWVYEMGVVIVEGKRQFWG